MIGEDRQNVYNIIKRNREALGMTVNQLNKYGAWIVHLMMPLDSYITGCGGWIIADGVVVGNENEV